MGIFGRMKTLLRANVNDLASKAENPEAILKQLILDMNEQLLEAKKQVRDIIADQKLIKKKLETAEADGQKWEKKAMLAVRAGEDSLAGEALERKQQADQLASDLRANWEAQKSNAEQLKVAVVKLGDKIKDAERKKNTLVARARRVDAQKKMATESITSDGETAFDAFERSAKKIENFEVEVEANAELQADIEGDDLELKFGDLEAESGSDDALAALKKKMGM